MNCIIFIDGSFYPVTATDHKGVGGCGSHDTRITFQPTPSQMKRLATMMNWSNEQIYTYFQAALNIIPLHRAINKNDSEIFYNNVISTITNKHENNMKRAPDDEYKSNIVIDSIAEVR